MDEPVLIRKVVEGDPTAWDLVVETFGDRLFRAACLLCRNDRDAEDMVQETFLRFAQSRSRFRGDSSIYTWLYGILLNVVRQERRVFSRLVYTDEPLEGEMACPDSGADMDRQTIANALLEAMRRLTPEHRIVLTLRYYEHLSVAEIASKLGLSPGTVKSRLFHARLQMRARVPENLKPLFIWMHILNRR